MTYDFDEHGLCARYGQMHVERRQSRVMRLERFRSIARSLQCAITVDRLTRRLHHHREPFGVLDFQHPAGLTIWVRQASHGPWSLLRHYLGLKLNNAGLRRLQLSIQLGKKGRIPVIRCGHISKNFCAG